MLRDSARHRRQDRPADPRVAVRMGRGHGARRLVRGAGDPVAPAAASGRRRLPGAAGGALAAAA